MKKIIALILALVMAVTALPMTALASSFIDVEDGKWYSEAIEFCAANGYMDGVGGGRFDRTANLTRAMFVVILAGVEQADLTPYKDKTPFDDVPAGTWYTAAVAWASENNITSGIGAGLFGPQVNISREQIALLLYAYSEYKSMDTSARTDISYFTDHADTHAWARQAVEWAVASGLLSGIGNNMLDPLGFCTREQTAVIIRAYVLKLLSGCDHEWVDVTCTTDGYCSKCGLKSELAPGHTTSNGICERCGEEIFLTAHHKLVYYLNTKGELAGDGDKCFYKQQIFDGKEIEHYVYLTPGDPTVYLRTEWYDPETGRLEFLEIELPNSEGLYYEHVSGAFTGEDIHFQIKGGFTAPLLDGYGDFEVLGYYGDEADRGIALVTANYLLVYTANVCSELMEKNASVSLTDYGFPVPITIVQ